MAAWVRGAEQHGGQRGAIALAWVPGVEDHRDLAQPGHGDRGSCIDDHDGVRIGGGDQGDQLVLRGRQLNRSWAPSLPSCISTVSPAGRPVPWLAATLALLSAETFSGAPGAEEVVSRLADALLTQALRVALTEVESSDGPGLSVLRDPQIAAAIELVHRDPERAWTVGLIASELALSRSAFAGRFRELVGELPKRYITADAPRARGLAALQD